MVSAPAALQRGERGVHRRVDAGVIAHRLAQHTETSAGQGLGLQAGGEIRRQRAARRRAGRIRRVGRRDRRQQQRRVGHGSRHRTGGVLGDRDRDDAAAAHHADRRLQAHQPAHRRRAQDAAVGFGADADGGQAGGDRRAGAGARAAGIAIEHIGVPGLPAARAPARRRTRRPEVGPLAEIRLAEDDRAGVAQPRHQEGVGRRLVIGEGERAGGVDHAHGVDVVLEQHRHAVERPAQLARRAFGVAAIGLGQRLRVHLEDGVEGRSAPCRSRRCAPDRPRSAPAT